MDKKIFIYGSIQKSTKENVYTFIASTSAIDRQGDSIDQSGWDLKDFKTNPVILWAHRYDELPLGKATDIRIEDNKLIFDMAFANHDKAIEVKKLVDDGILNATSVGFIPMQRNGNIITEAKLLEISIVPVPANQEALAVRDMSDILKKDIEEVLKPVDDLNIEDNITEEEKEDEVIEEPKEEITETEEIPEITEPTEELETKSGRVISAKTRKILETALSSFKTSVSEIEKLLAMEVATPDEADDVKSKYVVLSRDTLEMLQFDLRSENKRNEKVLSALKNLGN